MIYKRLLAFFLSFALIFSSTSALANTSVGGWSALDTITAGANNTINAAKTAGGKALKSSITVAASASKVGKHLIKGGGAAALAFAAVELIGEGVDWVLDPANNAIKYTVTESGSGAFPAGSWSPNQSLAPPFFGSVDALCKHVFGAAGCDDSAIQGDTVAGCGGTGSSRYCTVIGYRPAGGGSPPVSVEKSIPIATVAAKVIANAEAGHAPSQEAVKATALEGFAAGEHDAALDAAAIPDTGVENPTDPTDPTDPSKPVDLSPITAAINAIKAILSGILSSITSLTDWLKGEPEANKPEDNKIDIPEVPLPDIDSSVSFGGSCPADLGADFNLYGTNFNFVLMPFSKLCPLLSTFIKPTLILLGSFMAVAIVGGRKDA